LPTTKAIRFSVSARDGKAKASGTSAKVSAMQANRSLDVIFMMIFVPDEPIANAMLE
jgi:ferric-dicitrate binding protein FerR (iron transport regulator)